MVVTENGGKREDPVNPLLLLIHLKLICGSEAEMRSEVGAEFRLGSEGLGLMREFVWLCSLNV